MAGFCLSYLEAERRQFLQMSGSVFPKAVLDLKQFSCEFLVCHDFSCFSLFATEAELHMLVSLSGESNSSFTFILSLNSQDNASRKLLL